MKKLVVLVLLVALIFALSACSPEVIESTNRNNSLQTESVYPSDPETNLDTQDISETSSSSIQIDYDSEDLETEISSRDMTIITLEGESVTIEGSGAEVNENIVTISSAGSYRLSGSLTDGQVIVNTEDDETVVLVLDGVDIASSTSAGIYISNAEKTVITLSDNTENYVTDASSYTFLDAESDEPNAAIFSNDDLTINGSGSLIINANYNDGIASKDDLKITGGLITISALNDGIKGRDLIAVKDGTITISAGSDGLETTNNQETDQGNIAIDGGKLNITAGLDGIQAENQLLITGGELNIVSGGGSINGSNTQNWGNWGNPSMENNLDESDTTESAKGLKANVDITITGGKINIDSSDDSIHSNDQVTIENGEILLTSGDDGIHADSNLEINGGSISIHKSYEGIESAVITINDGNIDIISSDDGFNATGGNDGSSINGRPGQNNFFNSGNYFLYLNGGYVAIDAMGDGIDVNGTIDMTGGIVIVNGPTNNANGALDYLGEFTITGGYLIAAGSSGMAMAPSTSSTQYSVLHNFQSMIPGGTLVHIERADGGNTLTFVPAKEYQSILFSSPELENGSTYTIFVGGSSTGTAYDGLYTDGEYTPGTQAASLTISSIVTGASSPFGGLPTGGPGGRQRPPGP